jgi:hypothetical protein
MFLDPTSGFSMTLPAGWVLETAEDVEAQRRLIGLEHASPPLMTATKRTGENGHVTPTVQVLKRPKPGGPKLDELLRLFLMPIEQAFEGVRILEDATPMTIAGKPGAALRIGYVLGYNDDQPLSVEARQYLIDTGEFMFLLGMTGARRGTGRCEEEFAQMLVSVSLR